MEWNIAIPNSKRFICDDLTTLCKHLVNYSPVTPEFKKGKDVHPSLISGYAAPLLAIVGISTEFSGVITTQFSFLSR